MKQVERDELLIRLDERTRDVGKDIKEIKKTLHGNGKEGICDTVLRHETTIKNLYAAFIIATAVIVATMAILNFIF